MEPEMNEPDNGNLFIQKLVDLDEQSVMDQVREALANGEDPLQILETAQEGVRLVGVQYEAGKYYVAGLMMAGEIFREVMELVEPILVQHLRGTETGHILIGTAEGDIHDIGKNIFCTMLRSHGFTVTDLGVDVSPTHFIEAVIQIKPDIVGMHGLVTTSFDAMKSTIRLIKQDEDPLVSRTPIIIGGGLTNAMVCTYVGADYWATDGMVGVQICKQIMEKK